MNCEFRAGVAQSVERQPSNSGSPERGAPFVRSPLRIDGTRGGTQETGPKPSRGAVLTHRIPSSRRRAPDRIRVPAHHTGREAGPDPRGGRVANAGGLGGRIARAVSEARLRDPSDGRGITRLGANPPPARPSADRACQVDHAASIRLCRFSFESAVTGDLNVPTLPLTIRADRADDWHRDG
jgi:hypothetical protein